MRSICFVIETTRRLTSFTLNELTAVQAAGWVDRDGDLMPASAGGLQDVHF